MKTNYTKNINIQDLDRNYTITLFKEEYNKTGKSWHKVLDVAEVGTIDAEYYYNILDTVPLFRNLGGTETVVTTHTCAGCIPVEVSSVSPDKQTKIVRRFNFEFTPNKKRGTD